MQRINAVHSPHTAKLLRHSDHGKHGKKRLTLNTPHSFALIRVIRGLFLIYHRMTRMQRINAVHSPHTAKLLRHSDHRKPRKNAAHPEHAAFIRVNSRNSRTFLTYHRMTRMQQTTAAHPSTTAKLLRHSEPRIATESSDSHGKMRLTLNTPHSFALIRVIRGLFLIYHQLTRTQRTTVAPPPTTAKLPRHSSHGKHGKMRLTLNTPHSFALIRVIRGLLEFADKIAPPLDSFLQSVLYLSQHGNEDAKSDNDD
jgi:hypothetical protein